MKLNYTLFALLAGVFCSILPIAQAETDITVTTEKVSKKAKKAKKGAKKESEGAAEEAAVEESVLGAMLRKNSYFNNPEPNFNAQYFIFLKSASWCGPCNAEMPEVVNAYKQMKKSGKVELILLSHDQTEETATQWLKKFDATFPALMKGATLPQLPEARGIPNATIMSANGDVIQSGHGSIIRGWKQQTIGEYAVIGDDGEPRVGDALKTIKFTNGKPNRKADFYIYLYSPTPESADKVLLADLAEQYKEMKKNKVELIFISDSKTPLELTKVLKSCKAKFPAAQSKAAGASDLPGIGSMGSKSYAWIVTQSGAAVTEGTPDIARNWEKIVEANQN